MQVERWPSSGAGRSRTVAYGPLIWTVANTRDKTAAFEEQVRQSFRMLEGHLAEAGSARTHLLSVQVILADMGTRDVFDRLWQEWLGPQPEHWPQRASFQAALAPGLLLELIAVAAPATASQVVRAGST